LANDRLTAALRDDRLTAQLSSDRFILVLEFATMRTIYTSAGDTNDAVAVLTDITGADISADTIQVGLGSVPPGLSQTYVPPSVWYTPTSVVNTGIGSKTITLRIGPAGAVQPITGSYILWIRDSSTGTVTSVPSRNQVLTIA
jgi:hypothetical protein